MKKTNCFSMKNIYGMIILLWIKNSNWQLRNQNAKNTNYYKEKMTRVINSNCISRIFCQKKAHLKKKKNFYKSPCIFITKGVGFGCRLTAEHPNLTHCSLMTPELNIFDYKWLNYD